MDKELKAKWIKALRSWKYKQARGTMCDSTGALCCLGVLGHIQGIEKKALEKVGDSILAPWLNSAGIEQFMRNKLARMNDGNGFEPHSFRKIAAYIEANL